MSQTNLSTSGFKKFLLRALIPLLLFVMGGGYLFSIFFEKEIILKSNICGAYKVNRIINETHPNEIPIFGSSRAEEQYIPDILGSNYFNYGLNGTGTNVMLFFIKEECGKRKGSPLLILNFDLSGFTLPIGDISNYLYNVNYLPVKELLGKKYKISFSIPFIKYYGQYETYLKYYLNNKLNYTEYTDKGAAIKKSKMNAELLTDSIQIKQLPKGFATDTSLENKYMQVIDENPKRIFVFVIAPYYQPYYAGLKNLPEAEKFLNNLRREKNVKIIDFSREPYPDSLFSDELHLNYDGAARFSKELKDSITKISY